MAEINTGTFTNSNGDEINLQDNYVRESLDLLLDNKPTTDKYHLVCENGVLKWEIMQESIAVNEEPLSVNDEPIGF